MTTTQYVGARYVPLFKGEWDNTQTYEPLCIVSNQGNSYTSRQYVPTGIDISNEEYWALTGNYNAQIEAYRKEVAELSSKATFYFKTINELAEANLKLGDICYVSGRLSPNIGGGFYNIQENKSANGYEIIKCNNGLFAVFIPTSIVSPEQLEKPNTSDYSELLLHTIMYAKEHNVSMEANGVYNTSNPIIFDAQNDNLNVRINGTINYSGTDYAVKIKNKNSTYYFRAINAVNGSGIAFDQRNNDYEYTVSNHFVEFGKIVAKENGVGFIAANHGVLDIDVQCDISISANNCYYSYGGFNNNVSSPSYASEFHVRGGRLYGKNFAINIEVGNGYECTGHSYCDFSAEGSTKLINLDAGNGVINTVHLENVRIAEIGNNGMITATGDVRECDFWFNHLFMLPWFENNLTTEKSRGCYVHAPINMRGGSYTGYNCVYFAGDNYFSFSDIKQLYESGISPNYSWDYNGTTRPLSIISGTGTFDISAFPYFTNNGVPLYIDNGSKGFILKDGETTIFNGPEMLDTTYQIIKSNSKIRVVRAK